MTIHDLITTLSEKLLPEYNSPHLATQSAWWLLEKLTNKNEAQLVALHDLVLSQEQQAQLDQWISDIVLLHKPIAYILGSVPFLDLTIDVKPPILIPRPETEEWCAQLIEELKKLNQPFHGLDLCAGTGCIALALARAFPESSFIATDMSPQALELAEHNAQKNSISNVTFILSDLYQSIPSDTRFHIIASNPPYISPQEFEELDPSVTEWEDKRALVASENGLALIKEIITHAPHILEPQGMLWVEIGYKQGADVAQLFTISGFTEIEILKDFAGNDRVVKGKLDEIFLPHTTTSGIQGD